ncbi:MAG: glycosyltransferase 87 family protein [Chitinivibrionales bacterium]|nr:glycosyltransferase 87 family protein [Chitinivibrionales bacterium]
MNKLHNATLLILSVAIQLVAGFFLGHRYDMSIFMATGYLAGTGQNPYIPQDLSALFHSAYFSGLSSIGYGPLWPLMLGLVYRCSYALVPNLLVYNCAIKLPIMAANIGLAYLVEHVLDKMGYGSAVARRARIYLFFNPFLLYASSAWGQFDSCVAFFALLALILLDAGKLSYSAILLALAISLKPTALPLLPVFMCFLLSKSWRKTLTYCGILATGLFLFCVFPFVIFKWDPGIIFKHYNAHFIVGGGMSFMSWYELFKYSYTLTGNWQSLGMMWMPALAISILALFPVEHSLVYLLKKSAAFVLIFFLTRTWLSEPNIILVLSFVLILTLSGNLPPVLLTAVWVLPLIFGFFNTSMAQLLFPGFPGVMEQLLVLSDRFRDVRIVARTIIVVPWLIAGWWIVIACLKRRPYASANNLS